MPKLAVVSCKWYPLLESTLSSPRPRARNRMHIYSPMLNDSSLHAHSALRNMCWLKLHTLAGAIHWYDTFGLKFGF